MTILHSGLCCCAVVVSVGGVTPKTPDIEFLKSKIDWNDECVARRDDVTCGGVSLLQLHARKTSDDGDLDEKDIEVSRPPASHAHSHSPAPAHSHAAAHARPHAGGAHAHAHATGEEGGDGEEEDDAASLEDSDLIADLGLCTKSPDFTHAKIIQSNLGGAGPDSGDEVLTFGNVMEGTNLVISAMSIYTPNTGNPDGGALRNGVHQGFGVVNLASDSSVDLKFSFVDSETGDPKVIDSLMFTFFDGDHGKSHQSREAVTVSGFSAFKVSDETALDLTETATDDDSLSNGGGVATFTSTMNGGKAGNPMSPMNLNTVQGMKTAVFLFESKSEFLVTAGESGYAKAQGRNILFAGASALVCEEETKCSSMRCPAGSVHARDASFIVCKSIPCSDDDVMTCCHDE